jgi:hypothetical protein
MPESRVIRKTPVIDRAARVAFTFVLMNSSAVVGLIAALLGRKVWRR